MAGLGFDLLLSLITVANQDICFLSVCIFFGFDLHADYVSWVVSVDKVFKPPAIAPKLSRFVFVRT